MSCYFISNEYITDIDSLIAQIEAEGINAVIMEVAGDSGIVVNEDDINKVLEILDASVIDRSNSGYYELYRLTLGPGYAPMEDMNRVEDEEEEEEYYEDDEEDVRLEEGMSWKQSLIDENIDVADILDPNIYNSLFISNLQRYLDGGSYSTPNWNLNDKDYYSLYPSAGSGMKQICLGKGISNNTRGNVFIHLLYNMLTTIWDKDIIIDCPHGNWNDQVGDSETLVLKLWSGYSDSYEHSFNNAPYTLYGTTISRVDRVTPSYLEGTVEAPEGLDVAEIIGNTIYILFDAAHEGSRDEVRILLRIMADICKMVPMTGEERRAYSYDIRQRNKEIRGGLYINSYNEHYRNSMEYINSKIDAALHDIRRARNALATAYQDKKFYDTIYDGIKDMMKRPDDSILNDYKKLLLDKDISMVVPAKGSVSIFTNDIICHEPKSDKSYDLGRFRISIKLGLLSRETHINDVVRIFNLTRQVDAYRDGMHHPHIFHDGSACFGNLEEPLTQLVANGDIPVLAHMIISFLKTVNVEDSAGSYIDEWPEV